MGQGILLSISILVNFYPLVAYNNRVSRENRGITLLTHVLAPSTNPFSWTAGSWIVAPELFATAAPVLKSEQENTPNSDTDTHTHRHT